MVDFSDLIPQQEASGGLDFSDLVPKKPQVAAARPDVAGFEDLVPQQGSGVGATVREIDRAVTEGLIESTVATPLRGFGAQAPEFARQQLQRLGTINQPLAPDATPEERAAFRTRRGVQHPTEEVISERQQPFVESALRLPQEDPVFQAGEAVSRSGKRYVGPENTSLPPLVRDIASATGSVAGNIGVASIPGIGLPLMVAGATQQGAGEAAERAIKAGATPGQVSSSAALGTIPGATEFVDALLPQLGSTGKALGLIRRVGLRVLEGAAIEGGQEGLQQFIQNLITQGVYKPDQDIMEDVPRSMLIGAIVGGGTSAALGGREGPAAPAAPEDVQGSLQALMGTPLPPELIPPDAVASPLAPTPVPITPEQPPISTSNPAMPNDLPTSMPPQVSSFIQGNIEKLAVPEPSTHPAVLRAQEDFQKYGMTSLTPVLDGAIKTEFGSDGARLYGEEWNRLKAESLKPQGQEVRANAGANMGRLAKLLGANLYDPANMTTVSVKEMVQNSFDAIKDMMGQGQTDGNIALRMDPTKRTIAITDDGIGMPPEILGNQFLQIAGTQKETDDPSGGLGIAKMLFLFGNQALAVTTMHKGKVSRMVTTGQELMSALNDPTKNPKITVSAPTTEDHRTFPKGHGTAIVVKVPEQFKDTATGEMKNIAFSQNVFYHDVLNYSPLFRNIAVTLNGQPVQGMGKDFAADSFTQFANVNFNWGTARIYVSKEPSGKDSYRDNMHVLSGGLWQFSAKLPEDMSSPYGPAVDRVFYLDLKPKVKPEDPGYPFDLSRQKFTGAAQKDFNQIFNYMNLLYTKEKFASSVKNWGDVHYVSVEPDGTVRASDRIKVEPKIPPAETALSMIHVGDSVTIKDGKLVVGGRTIPELTPEDMKKARINLDELQIDQTEIDPDRVMIHDNISVTLSGAAIEANDVPYGDITAPHMSKSEVTSDGGYEVRSTVELGREKFGARFDRFLHDIGAAFIHLRDVVADAMTTPLTIDQTTTFAEPQGNYEEMKKEAVGISFDVKYRGVSIRVPFAGFFVNPAATEYRDTLRASIGIVGTMVHELAHHKIRDHDADFPAEMQRIIIHLDTHPTFSFHDFKQGVVNTWAKNEDIANFLYGVLDGSVGPISPRGKQFKESSNEQTGNGGTPQQLAAAVPGAGSPGGPTAGLAPSAQAVGPVERPPNVSVSVSKGSGGAADNGRSRNQRALDATGEGDAGADPVQPETAAIRDSLSAIFDNNTPPAVRSQAAHADKMNVFYKYMAGLDQLVQLNKFFTPLIRYYEGVRDMHLDESKLHDAALRLAKDWRSFGVDEGNRVAGFLNELTNMTYRAPSEVRNGISRHPSQLELNRLVDQYKLSADGIKLVTRIKQLTDGFLQLIGTNAIEHARRTIQDPARLQARIAAIQRDVQALSARPYFPFMRFGRHYVAVKDPAGKLIHFETVEGQGFEKLLGKNKAAERAQQRVAADHRRTFQQDYGRAPTDQEVYYGVLPESVGPLIGMPQMLLDQMKDAMFLSPDQTQATNMLAIASALGMTPVLNPRYQKRYFRPGQTVYTPGYSMDFRRSFARFFFHGAKFYSKTKYLDGLRALVTEAESIPGNKEGYIAAYMRDHLNNTVLDARGDFGIFKAAIFFWAMGYVPAAATQNLSQTPMITFPFLGAKFGDISAGREIIKAMNQISSFYKRGRYDNQTDFEMRALGYGIKTGRISETQAPELAGIAQGTNLLKGIGGNQAEQSWVWFMEKSAWMFEHAEQWNRRIAYRAALNLALKNPKAKFIEEAVHLNEAEFQRLQVEEGFSEAQARAVVTANHAVEQTQYTYARWARPRAFRGKASILFVFKKYIQSTLMMLGNNKRDVLPRYLLISAFIGGLGGLPFAEDFMSALKAIWHWLGYHTNLEHEARKYIIQFSNGQVPPDMVLHGFSRRGLGLPALLDMMGSLATGRPGRGLAAPRRGMDPATGQELREGYGQNIPFPVLDRSRALGLGMIAPFDIGKFATPSADQDRVIAEQAQKASGAVFSVGFNIYKSIMDNKLPMSDFKRWERSVPRQLGDMSRMWRTYSEGRERSKGGPAGGSTIVPFDPRDTEEMMEILAMGMGYQPLRTQARWDSIMAKVEVEKFYDLQRNGLLNQLFEARSGKHEPEIQKVIQSIKEFNQGLPEEARGKAITSDTAHKSLQAKERGRVAREAGVPTQRTNVPISREIDRLFPESTVDVRRVR